MVRVFKSAIFVILPGSSCSKCGHFDTERNSVRTRLSASEPEIKEEILVSVLKDTNVFILKTKQVLSAWTFFLKWGDTFVQCTFSCLLAVEMWEKRRKFAYGLRK